MFGSVHSGKTRGDVPLKFPAADRARYKQVVANFSDFLRKCYSKPPLVYNCTRHLVYAIAVEECQASALSAAEGFLPVAAGAIASSEERWVATIFITIYCQLPEIPCVG